MQPRHRSVDHSLWCCPDHRQLADTTTVCVCVYVGVCVCVCVCVCVFQREMKHSFSSKPDTRPTNIPLRSALFRNKVSGCSQSHHTAMIKHLLCGLVASRETGDYIYFTFEEFCWHSFPETYNDSINKISSKFIHLLSETRSWVRTEVHTEQTHLFRLGSMHSLNICLVWKITTTSELKWQRIIRGA